MRNFRLSILTTLLLLLVASQPAESQFYNGLQMNFGRNRVQHYDFYWMFYRFPGFDCYYNEKGRELAQYTSSIAEKRIIEIEDYFDYRLENRMLFIVFDKHGEFRQSNVGISVEETGYNTGGRSKLIENKVLLYYEGNRRAYNNQISEAIARSVVNEMFSDAEVRDRTGSSNSIHFPGWYIDGLVAYVAGTWDFQTENRVKEGFADGRFNNLNNLE